jgi:mercuric ion binding protein
MEIFMRKLLFAALLATPLGVLGADPQTVVLDVQNMTCELCPITVKKALDKIPGVASTKIDFDKKTATVRFDPERANIAALVKATTDAGYPSSAHH